MPHVTSSAIRDVAYDPATRDLRVTFHTGRIYAYHGVPQDLYDALIAAPSVGGFFNQHIRDDKRFPFTEERRR